MKPLLYSLFLFSFTFSVLASTPYQATVSILKIPLGAGPQAFAIDMAGNVFIVSSLVTPSGLPQIHVDKTDSLGNILAGLDFGGSNIGDGIQDSIAGAAVDPQGNLVIVGSTSSADFPTVSPLIANTGRPAAFITKIDSQLTTILFSTTLGGTQGGTSAGGVALDNAGNIYVTGSTYETDFPVTPGAFQKQPVQIDQTDNATYAFLTKISSASKIAFSTYFGSSAVSCAADADECSGVVGITEASAVELDASGNIIIAGSTTSNQIPVTPGVFGPNCGVCGITASDTLALAGFLAKFSTDGSKLLWATYVPITSVGSGPYEPEVQITRLALDGAGDIVAAGTASPGLSTTVGALQSSPPPFIVPSRVLPTSGFIMKFDSVAQHLVFSTYFGEEAFFTFDSPGGLAIDPQGTIWVTGESLVNTLPAPAGTVVLGESYVAGLSPDGSGLVAIFTAPSGAAGAGVALTTSGIVALGAGGQLLSVSPGTGPSFVGVGNSAGSSVSNAVAPYELISLFGLGIGPTTTAGADVVKGEVTNSLGGVQVLFDGTPAPLLYVGPTQVNAIVPGLVYQRETTTLQIVTPSGTLKGPTMEVRSSQPGVFVGMDPTLLLPPAAALNQDGSVNSAANPAALGSIVTVWASGTGISTSAPVPDGAILEFGGGGPTLPVAVYSFPVILLEEFIALPTGPIGLLAPGALSCEILFAGDAPGVVAGVSQINFRVPADAIPTNVGFQLQVGNVLSAPFSIYLKPQQ